MLEDIQSLWDRVGYDSNQQRNMTSQLLSDLALVYLSAREAAERLKADLQEQLDEDLKQTSQLCEKLGDEDALVLLARVPEDSSLRERVEVLGSLVEELRGKFDSRREQLKELVRQVLGLYRLVGLEADQKEMDPVFQGNVSVQLLRILSMRKTELEKVKVKIDLCQKKVSYAL